MSKDQETLDVANLLLGLKYASNTPQSQYKTQASHLNCRQLAHQSQIYTPNLVASSPSDIPPPTPIEPRPIFSSSRLSGDDCLKFSSSFSPLDSRQFWYSQFLPAPSRPSILPTYTIRSDFNESNSSAYHLSQTQNKIPAFNQSGQVNCLGSSVSKANTLISSELPSPSSSKLKCRNLRLASILNSPEPNEPSIPVIKLQPEGVVDDPKLKQRLNESFTPLVKFQPLSKAVDSFKLSEKELDASLSNSIVEPSLKRRQSLFLERKTSSTKIPRLLNSCPPSPNSAASSKKIRSSSHPVTKKHI